MPVHSFSHYLRVELFVLLATIVVSFIKPWQRAVEWLEGRLAPLARRPMLCSGVIFALGIGVRLSLLGFEPMPRPLFHDEFSYLLGADTFAHWRLTNPQPPVPLAFETIHTNMWPSYQSMYMPGTSLVLAAGELVGHPWFAVVVGTALFCALVYWMVAGWLPRGYALATALAAVTISEGMNWWFDNYFLIALPAIGGVLVLGSLPRIYQQRASGNARWWALALGVGLAILILTRPYEGFCLAFAPVMVLLWTLRRLPGHRLLALAAVPAAVLALTFAWLFYYNLRGTGHALLFPYMVNYRDYHITGPFLFSAKKPVPTYHNRMLASFFPGAELPQYDFAMHHPVEFLLRKLTVYYYSYLFGFGLLILAGTGYLARRWRQGLLLAPLAALAGFSIELVLMAWAPFPQYAAPASACFYLLLAFGIYFVRHLRWRGIALVRGLVLAELLVAANLFALRVRHHAIPPEPQYVSIDRDRVERALLAQPGKQLCLVRYTPGHDGWQEWVFNGADIPGEQVIWARSLDPETDRQVVAAYPGRHLWLARPDEADALLTDLATGKVEPLPENHYRK